MTLVEIRAQTVMCWRVLVNIVPATNASSPISIPAVGTALAPTRQVLRKVALSLSHLQMMAHCIVIC